MSRPFLVSKGQPVQPVEHISRDPVMVAVLSVIVLVTVGLKN